MTSKQALIKTLVWRFGVAIPTSFLSTYYYIGQVFKSVELTIILNLIATILYYIFDLYWYNKISEK